MVKNLKHKKPQTVGHKKGKQFLKISLYPYMQNLYLKIKNATDNLLKNRDIDTNQKGNFLFDFDKLTIDELTNIVFKAIINCANKDNSPRIRLNDLCSDVGENLCNAKYLLGTFEHYKEEITYNDFYGDAS